jgi:hypothetical protein
MTQEPVAATPKGKARNAQGVESAFSANKSAPSPQINNRGGRPMTQQQSLTKPRKI